MTWKHDAPDHWRRDLSASVCATVWPRRDGWRWEVFDFSVDPDDEVMRGSATSFEAATQEAERAAMAYLEKTT